MEPFVINIGRQLGSGGRAIGHILADKFGISYYDREILNLAAKESGFCPEVFERTDEKNNFLRTLGNIIEVSGTHEGQPISLTDLNGRTLFRTTAHGTTLTLSANGLPHGTYLVNGCKIMK